jgi:hypothetical protein
MFVGHRQSQSQQQLTTGIRILAQDYSQVSAERKDSVLLAGELQTTGVKHSDTISRRAKDGGEDPVEDLLAGFARPSAKGISYPAVINLHRVGRNDVWLEVVVRDAATSVETIYAAAKRFIQASSSLQMIATPLGEKITDAKQLAPEAYVLLNDEHWMWPTVNRVQSDR